MALTEALARFIATPEIKSARLIICNSCDKKHETLPVCKECHCVLPAKAALKEPSCPLNKWTE